MRFSIIVASLCVVASAILVMAGLPLYNNDNERQQVLDIEHVERPPIEAADEERHKYIIMFKQSEVNAQNFEPTIAALENRGVTVDERLPIINGVTVRMTEPKRFELEEDDNIDVIEEDKEVHLFEYKNYY